MTVEEELKLDEFDRSMIRWIPAFTLK